jgi:hypothetical protein
MIVEQILDYEPSRNLHKCKNSHDGSTQWLDLKKKPVRNVPVATGAGGHHSGNTNHNGLHSRDDDDDDDA